VLAPARENQLQCVGIHAAAAFALRMFSIILCEVYQGWNVTNLRLSVNGVHGHKCAAPVKNDIILQIDIALLLLVE